MKNCWINTVRRDHVKRGEKRGIVQAGHCKRKPLERLDKGDRMIFYFSRGTMIKGEKVQAFTGAATIADDEIYRVELRDNFKPWRRNAIFEKVEEQSIRPLIEVLNFIENPRYGEAQFEKDVRGQPS